MGGDEFTLALVRADAQLAERVLTRLRSALDDVMHRPGRREARRSAPGSRSSLATRADRDELLQCADTALYWGKDEGRGRSLIYRPRRADAPRRTAARRPCASRSLLSTLTALAKAVDSKSRWTLGPLRARGRVTPSRSPSSFDLPRGAGRRAAARPRCSTTSARSASATRSSPRTSRSTWRRSTSSSATRSSAARCSPAPGCPSWRAGSSTCTSASTATATRTGSPGARSRWRAASSTPPTRSTR